VIHFDEALFHFWVGGDKEASEFREEILESLSQSYLDRCR